LQIAGAKPAAEATPHIDFDLDLGNIEEPKAVENKPAVVSQQSAVENKPEPKVVVPEPVVVTPKPQPQAQPVVTPKPVVENKPAPQVQVIEPQMKPGVTIQTQNKPTVVSPQSAEKKMEVKSENQLSDLKKKFDELISTTKNIQVRITEGLV
jgi:outer membrane biosynthesis protein TonB